MSHRIFLIFPLAFNAIVLLTPSPGQAQMTDTMWNETLSLSADFNTGGQPGLDSGIPEDLSDELSGSQYSIGGSVTFGPPGPPQATSTVNGSYTSGLSTFLGGTAYARIDFTFQVRQTSAPPVSVSSIPVSVHVAGSADATGDAVMLANALSQFVLSTTQGPLTSYEVAVDNISSPGSDSFTETYQTSLGPLDVVSGAMTATANVSAEGLQSGTQATATAFIDPIIEVGDEMIPGTSSSYRDHFEIEFGPGYFAQGSVPVEPTTWGQIKQRYSR